MYLQKLVAYHKDATNDKKSDEVTDWLVTEDGKLLNEGNTYTASLDQLLAHGFRPFVCPCDGRVKYVMYQPNKHEPKYGEVKPGKRLENSAFYVDGEENEENNVYYSDNVKRLEKAEISMENFGNFKYGTYNSEGKKNPSHDDDVAYFCGEDVKTYEYVWEDTDIKMTSLQGDQKIYYIEDAGIRYQVAADTNETDIKIAFNELKKYSKQESNGITWGDLVESYIDEDTQMISTDGNGVSGMQYYKEGYLKKIVFYTNVKWTIVEDTGKETTHVTRCPVGTFYIVEDWNVHGGPIQDLIHPINSGINDVQVFERMEKCKATETFVINTDTNLRMGNYRYIKEYSDTDLTVYIDPKTMKPYEPNTDWFRRHDGSVVHGNLRIIKQYDIYYKWTRTVAKPYTSLGTEIVVDAKHYPGTYRLVGETYARRRSDGKDERFQFEIPLCKMASDTNLTFQADGDPTTYTMNLKVLRKEDGTMMKLTQYAVDCNKYDGYASGSTKIVPQARIIIDSPFYKNDELDRLNPDNTPEPYFRLHILSPENGAIYYFPLDAEYQSNGKAYVDIVEEDLGKYDKKQLVVKLEKYIWSKEINDYVLDEANSKILKPDEFTIELTKV